ncbi:MAG: LysM peptidoglycan-binding domain-containing protein [Bdellovibrionota bacterium]
MRNQKRKLRLMMWLKKICSLPLLWNLTLCVLLADPASAQTPPKNRPPEFTVSGDIQGKIDFWKAIFTKYGEKQLVFHHREHPEIVYSVLDLTEYARTYSGKELARKTNEAVEEELTRIRQTLTHFADGGAPRNPAERRLQHLFSMIPGNERSNYAQALEEDQIRYQKGVRELYRDGLIRSGRYLHAMEKVFVREGLPVELTRLPLVESSFNYNAYSSVGAAGIWQFMRDTGRKYLRVDASIDQRRDPIMASRAAARYLGDAYNRLGSWPLAITSYNHGVTGVLRAVNETGSRDLGVIIRNYDGSSWGFASKNFYAEFMAALEVEQNSERYFPGLVREDPWYFDELRLGRSVTFGELAKLSGSDQDTLVRLNPEMMKPVTTGRVRIPAGLTVKVPVGRGRVVLASISDSELISTESGATVVRSVGAKRAPELAQLATKGALPVKLPEKSVKASESDEHDDGGGATKYKVRSGETLGAIAARHGVPVSTLLKLNPGLKAKYVRAGREINVPGAKSDVKKEKVSANADITPTAAVTTKARKAADKRVDKRESTSQDTSSAEDAKASSAKSGTSKPDKNTEAGAKAGAGPKTYTVQSGDTLSSIAKKVGVSVERLKKLNPGAKKGLKPGQSLVTQKS